ncbi:MAG: TonB-dependent receptor [Sandaracinaceae bacterium]|nr:TonB-dependent receptor [Sandaracinaceae bacterium]
MTRGRLGSLVLLLALGGGVASVRAQDAGVPPADGGAATPDGEDAGAPSEPAESEPTESEPTESEPTESEPILEVEPPDLGPARPEDAAETDAAPTDAEATDPEGQETDEPADDEVEGELDVDAIEDVSLEELLGMTVTATGTQMTLDEAPSVVEVISYRDIRQRGYRTIADALRHVAGIHMIDDHLYQLAGVRGIFSATGTPNDVIQVMINGQPTAFRPTAGNFLGFELIPIEAVDRIEILRGPASALYGANAFLGVINIITFQGSDSELSRRSRHQLTLDGYLMQNPNATTGNGSASFLTAAEVEGFRFLLTGAFHYSDRSGLQVPGIDDLIQASLFRVDPSSYRPPRGYPSPGWDDSARELLQANPISRDDYERTASFYGIGSYQFSDEARLSVDGNFQYFDRNAEWQDFSFLTHDTRITHLNGFGRVRLELGSHEPENFALDASFTVSGGQPTDDDRIIDRLVPGQYQRRRMGNVALDAVVQGDYTFAPHSSVRLGVDYAHDFEDLLRVESINIATNARTDDGGFGQREFITFGAYAQVTWNPWDRLQLTAGARVDHNSVIACNTEVWNCLGDIGDTTVAGPTGESVLIDGRGIMQLSSRAAVVYEFPVAGLYAKLIYGSSYKPPAPYQLFRNRLTISGSSLGNPALQPQTANTVEAQIGIRPFAGFHASVVGFSTWVDDTVLFLVEEGRMVGRNADVEVQGLEASVSYTADDIATFFANGSFLLHSEVRPQQRREETDFEWMLSQFNRAVPVGRYPDVMVTGGLNLRFEEAHLNANLAVRVIGPRRASLVNNQLFNRDLSQTYELPAYFDADLTISTIGLRPFGDRETILSLSFRGVPGGFVEPGGGGVDVPGLGSRIYLRIQQEL